MLAAYRFSAAFDDQLYPTPRTYPLNFSFSRPVSIANVTVSLKNIVSNLPLSSDDIYVNTATLSSPDSFHSFLSDSRVKQVGDSAVLSSGEYVLHQDTSVSNLVLNPGVTLLLDAGVSILVYDSLFVNGTSTHPVVVTSLTDEPFGSVAVLGNGSETSISWLDLSGGSDDFVDGLHFLGALAIHNAKVNIQHSTIHHNFADDGLNIKYGSVFLDQNVFRNNFADQVDLDFVTGVVQQSTFVSGTDTNGDGLDLSGSDVLITSNSFSGFKDKGLSVGEATTAKVFANDFSKNAIGIAIKDSSEVYALHNFFSKNQLSFSAYQKKPFFGGGRLFTFNNTFQQNNRKIQLDDLSSFNVLSPQETIEVTNGNKTT